MTLDVEKFSPKKAELVKMADEYSALTIDGVDDKEGYEAVHKGRMELKKTRIEIQKTGKSLRSEAIAFQKAVLAKEKEFIEIIEPLEKSLEEKQNAIDDEKERIKRISLLPARKERLERISLTMSDDEILSMDENQFNEYFNEQNAIYLEAKERRLQEEKDKLEKEKLEKERAEEISKEVKEEARLDYERKLQEQKEKFEREKREKEEEGKRAKEEDERKKEAEKRAEVEAKEKMEKDKKYQDFLEECGYNEKDFKIERSGNRVICYKKVGEIII